MLKSAYIWIILSVALVGGGIWYWSRANRKPRKTHSFSETEVGDVNINMAVCIGSTSPGAALIQRLLNTQLAAEKKNGDHRLTWPVDETGTLDGPTVRLWRRLWPATNAGGKPKFPGQLTQGLYPSAAADQSILLSVLKATGRTRGTFEQFSEGMYTCKDLPAADLTDPFAAE